MDTDTVLKPKKYPVKWTFVRAHTNQAAKDAFYNMKTLEELNLKKGNSWRSLYETGEAWLR